MSSYLGKDLKFKYDPLSKTRSSIEFILSIVPRDIPLNTVIGVEIPDDTLVSDFCESYKSNLIEAINSIGLDIEVEEVSLNGKLLQVKLKYSSGTIEMWSLSI